MVKDAKVSLLGYGSLVGLVVLGLAGALGLGGLGLQAYFAASESPVANARDGRALVASLEGALVIWCFGVLAFVVAVTAFIVLLKSLADDVARARRGPV
jgi:hypothetical protein